MPQRQHILVSGASGLIGSALIPALLSSGHTVVRLQRSDAPPAPGEATWSIEANRVSLDQIGSLQTVVHLAGENVGQRWTKVSKRRMWSSRCDGTRLLCQALNAMPKPPRVLVCASAIGYYGDRQADWVDETTPRGEGFLAELVEAWESATEPARAAGIRVVHLRLGIVLAREGGALAQMLPAFRLGLAGRLGDGQQYWSWIARSDVIRAILYALALEQDPLEGAVNVVAPAPVRNLEFTKTLGAVLSRPTCLPVPRVVIQALFGQMGRETILSSCRAKPSRLIASGFSFEHSELASALRSVLSASKS